MTLASIRLTISTISRYSLGDMKYRASIETKGCPVCQKDKPHHAKGMCNACYHRLERHRKVVDKSKKSVNHDPLTDIPSSGTL